MNVSLRNQCVNLEWNVVRTRWHVWTGGKGPTLTRMRQLLFFLRTTALLLSVSHLVLITRNACHSPSGMDWIDQSLSAAGEHMAVLREAALASEPECVAPAGAESFLQEQSAI